MTAFDGLPGVIRIGPFDIRVVYDTADLKSPPESWGMYQHGVQIELDATQPPGVVAVDTVLHECLHGILRCAGWPRKEEEKIVAAIATGITQLLRDNPQLLAWMVAALKS
jgi:hypothetical protein